MTKSLAATLARAVGSGVVLKDVPPHYLYDATESRGLRGYADAVALPRDTTEIANIVKWCYAHEIPIVPRGGGTGFSGGCVPTSGVVLSLERLQSVLHVDPLLWRMQVEAGVTTSRVQAVAKANGLLFPPDPGAAEQSQIGGNVATNAGGPHAFRYGVTGTWVTGLEVVLPPGELIRCGGPVRKDVAGYDLKALLTGSEGTLGVVTSVWLRLMPAPEVAWPIIGLFAGAKSGCAAIEALIGNGLAVSTLDFLDARTYRIARPTLPLDAANEPHFMVIAEADGTEASAAALRKDVIECLSENAVEVHAPQEAPLNRAFWSWRDGIAMAVSAVRGGKVSEDVAVPIDRLAELLQAVERIGHQADIPTCNWGHGGDGNVHATFLVAADDENELERAERAAAALFLEAIKLGGTVSGEHGIGSVKRMAWERQFGLQEQALQRGIKHAFDPKGLMNPGKKIPTVPQPALWEERDPVLIG